MSCSVGGEVQGLGPPAAASSNDAGQLDGRVVGQSLSLEAMVYQPSGEQYAIVLQAYQGSSPYSQKVADARATQGAPLVGSVVGHASRTGGQVTAFPL